MNQEEKDILSALINAQTKQGDMEELRFQPQFSSEQANRQFNKQPDQKPGIERDMMQPAARDYQA